MRIEGKTFKADASIKKPTRSRLFYWGNFVGHWGYIRQALLRQATLRDAKNIKKNSKRREMQMKDSSKVKRYKAEGLE